jgi:hypothetical protein
MGAGIVGAGAGPAVLGILVGAGVGILVGAGVGILDGTAVGAAVGILVGNTDGDAHPSPKNSDSSL